MMSDIIDKANKFVTNQREARAREKFAAALVNQPKPKGFSKFGPGGVRLVFGNDMYTPCMVYYKDGSATLHCALHEGEVEGHHLNERQATWLGSFSEAAEGHINAVRGDNWQG